MRPVKLAILTVFFVCGCNKPTDDQKAEQFIKTKLNYSHDKFVETQGDPDAQLYLCTLPIVSSPSFSAERIRCENVIAPDMYNRAVREETSLPVAGCPNRLRALSLMKHDDQWKTRAIATFELCCIDENRSGCNTLKKTKL